ncbi:MAG: hypothetical protein M3Z75_17500, partial [Actinomycetota bacterium]|nr:hypothetical protein [Actinomycetota bacterium]
MPEASHPPAASSANHWGAAVAGALAASGAPPHLGCAAARHAGWRAIAGCGAVVLLAALPSPRPWDRRNRAT